MGATVNNAIKALPSFLRPIDCGGKQNDYSAHGLAVAKTRELPDFDPDFQNFRRVLWQPDQLPCYITGKKNLRQVVELGTFGLKRIKEIRLNRMSNSDLSNNTFQTSVSI